MGVEKIENIKRQDVGPGGNNLSEVKRLKSLKEKKEKFKAKEQAIQNALRNLDSQPKNNKIVFDADIDDVPAPKVRKKELKDLFEDDDNEVENGLDLNWTEKNEFRPDKNYRNQFAFGNDERFKLDDKFLEDEETQENIREGEEDELNLEKEKEWQMNLLEGVLGVPTAPKVKDTLPEKKSMIRYDPSKKAHESYEMSKEQEPKKTQKKAKIARSKVDINESSEKPAEVSKDIYYTVSQNLTKSFEKETGFSLLKTFGTEEPSKKNASNYQEEPQNTQSFKFTFDTKNPFKYDSSDGENDENESNKRKSNVEPQPEQLPSFSFSTNQFFFGAKDERFAEALKFFSKEAVTADEFKNIRYELKQIMRAKIRNNMLKSQPWSGKKKIKDRQKFSS